MPKNSTKIVAHQEEWDKVAKELEHENLKLMSYDNTLLSHIGALKGKRILDYGAGPGVLAMALSRLGAAVKVYDISLEMRENAGHKIGAKNVYEKIVDIPKDFFDIVICNLVLCIVPENEVREIVKNIHKVLKHSGLAYIGFCNPKIFNVAESNLDFRFSTGSKYEVNHNYKKIKKEGGYEIIESHRPIEWYEKVYKEGGFNLANELFTPEYKLKGHKIKDFIIFKLKRA